MGKILFGDADAGIGDLDRYLLLLSQISNSDGYRSPLGELDCVTDQVGEDLLELAMSERIAGAAGSSMKTIANPFSSPIGLRLSKLCRTEVDIKSVSIAGRPPVAPPQILLTSRIRLIRSKSILEFS
jgi:hypothetical protein